MGDRIRITAEEETLDIRIMIEIGGHIKDKTEM